MSVKGHFIYMTIVGCLGMGMCFTTFFFDFRKGGIPQHLMQGDDMPLNNVKKREELLNKYESQSISF